MQNFKIILHVNYDDKLFEHLEALNTITKRQMARPWMGAARSTSCIIHDVRYQRTALTKHEGPAVFKFILSVKFIDQHNVHIILSTCVFYAA